MRGMPARMVTWNCVLALAAALTAAAGCGDARRDATPATGATDSTASVPPVPTARDSAPPLEAGVYVARGICFGEGACFRHWRAIDAVPLHAQADPASPVVATVAPGQWAEPMEGQFRLLPRRGVVQRATVADSITPALAVGDMVYMLEPRGEGTYLLWHRGTTTVPDWTELSDQEPIRWDPPREAPPGVVLGWWVRLRTEAGATGWTLRPRFACMTKLGGDTGCRG